MKDIYICLIYYRYQEDWIAKKAYDSPVEKHWVVVCLDLTWTFLDAKYYCNL